MRSSEATRRAHQRGGSLNILYGAAVGVWHAASIDGDAGAAPPALAGHGRLAEDLHAGDVVAAVAELAREARSSAASARRARRSGARRPGGGRRGGARRRAGRSSLKTAFAGSLAACGRRRCRTRASRRPAATAAQARLRGAETICMRNAYTFARTSRQGRVVCSDTAWDHRLWQGHAMRHRHRLPQLDAARPFLTDGGLETTLIFHRGVRPAVLRRVRVARGRRRPRGAAALLHAVPRPRARARVGFVLDTATWRANPDWAARLGYGLDDLDAANRAAVTLAEELRAAGATEATPIVINGVIGPRGDGYDPGELMTADEAQRYHARQIATLRRQRGRHGHRASP